MITYNDVIKLEFVAEVEINPSVCRIIDEPKKNPAGKDNKISECEFLKSSRKNRK